MARWARSRGGGGEGSGRAPQPFRGSSPSLALAAFLARARALLLLFLAPWALGSLLVRSLTRYLSRRTPPPPRRSSSVCHRSCPNALTSPRRRRRRRPRPAGMREGRGAGSGEGCGACAGLGRALSLAAFRLAGGLAVRCGLAVPSGGRRSLRRRCSSRSARLCNLGFPFPRPSSDGSGTS